MPLELTPAEPRQPKRAPAAGSWWSRLNSVELTRARISRQDRMLFTERLELLLETGVTLLEALEVLHKQTDQPRLEEILADLVKTVGEGQPFSAALGRHPAMFSQMY